MSQFKCCRAPCSDAVAGGIEADPASEDLAEKGEGRGLRETLQDRAPPSWLDQEQARPALSSGTETMQHEKIWSRRRRQGKSWIIACLV